jgi:hypothetical protein
LISDEDEEKIVPVTRKIVSYCFLHTSESYCFFFSGYYKFFKPVDGYEMDFDSEEYSEGIYIHVVVLVHSSALLLNVPDEELAGGLF